MLNSSRGRLFLPGSFAVLLALTGCDEGQGKAPSPAPSQPAPDVQANVPPANVPPPPGNPSEGGEATGLKAIMKRIGGRGPDALGQSLGRQLKEEPTPWDAIQPGAKEFAKLASEMGQYDPPKGDKESWTKLTTEFAETASELDQAAQAKDKDAALAAQGSLSNSCMACHRQHRVMGPGGGRGGPGGGFGRPGGGPPGGGPPPAPGGATPQ